jgi:hypothetical protein
MKNTNKTVTRKNTKMLHQKQNNYSSNHKPNKMDNELLLRPEYKGQTAIVIKINSDPVLITSTVGAGYSLAKPLRCSDSSNFSTRFQGFLECRLIKDKATAKNFSANNSGIGCMWFTEDDSTTPSSAIALDAKALQYNYASIDKNHKLSYVPHDPTQQQWTTVASHSGGVGALIGYLKLYTNITNFGCPTAATQLGSVTLEYTVQFRGLV